MRSPALSVRWGLAFMCFVALDVNAAPTPGETDLIRERQARLLEEQRRRLEALKDLPGTPATS